MTRLLHAGLWSVVGLGLGCLPGPEVLTRTADVEVLLANVAVGDEVRLTIDGRQTEATIDEGRGGTVSFFDEVGPGPHDLALELERGVLRLCAFEDFEVVEDEKVVLVFDAQSLSRCVDGPDAGAPDAGVDAGAFDAGFDGGVDAGLDGGIDAGPIIDLAVFQHLEEETEFDGCVGPESQCEALLRLSEGRILLWRAPDQSPQSVAVSEADFAFVVTAALGDEADALFASGCTPTVAEDDEIKLKRKISDAQGEDVEGEQNVSGCEGLALELRDRLHTLRDIYFDEP